MSAGPQFSRLPWYPADFAASTRGWPLLARGAYRELLDAQWTMGALPADHATLRAIVGATPAEWRKAWPYLEPKFPIGGDGQRRNERLEHHRGVALELHAKRQAGAKKTNAKRWGKVVPIGGADSHG